jgi:hypothetical protein
MFSTSFHLQTRCIVHIRSKEARFCKIVNHHCLEVIVRFVDIGGLLDHHCLEVIVRFVDIGKIVNHHCLEVIVRFVDIGGLLDHHCLEVIVRFVDIGKIVNHSSDGQEVHQYQQNEQLPLISTH